MGTFRLSISVTAFALVSCGGGGTARQSPALSEEGITEAIEKQVIAQHPEFDLRHYTRLYQPDDNGNIDGTYLLSSMGGLPPKWKGGKSYWVRQGEVPQVLDGGCAVINLRYHVTSKTLVSVSCNGDA
jgi:hypothetical protein